MAEESFDDDEEDYQLKLLRSLFSNSKNDGDDDEYENNNLDIISEYTWICPNTDISIIYHLAFLAPGHGDSIWNSSECIAQHLLLPEYRDRLFKNACEMKWPPSRCIEFGAGAALPSLVLLREGTNQVIITDRFVNQETFDAIQMSVDKNIKIWGGAQDVNDRVEIMSHTWGEEMEKLTQQTNNYEDDGECKHSVDLLIASDCIYNPTYHKSLLESAKSAMLSSNNNSLFIVGYSLHGNVPPSHILNFFNLAKDEYGLGIINEFTKEYDGQRGIGSLDSNRGKVYVKVLAKIGK